MKTKSMSPSFVTIQAREFETPVMIQRSKIIAVEPMRTYSVDKVVTVTRIRCYNGITYTIDTPPTIEGMQSLMPL